MDMVTCGMHAKKGEPEPHPTLMIIFSFLEKRNLQSHQTNLFVAIGLQKRRYFFRYPSDEL